MSKPVLFALVDCNNFFVSCERLFRPDLEGKPVVVLSSNDGCAVSRSNEAKAIGIPMGAPAFKHRELFKRHQVVTLSANFELYGNVSRRITALLTSITPRTEIYSIDESFLDISSLPITNYEQWGAEVRQLILDWVGIPVSIGIAPTKTLAKLANLQAKKDPETNGVLCFVENRKSTESLCIDYQKINQYLAKTPVSDIWGIGWRLAPKMRGEGIGTALAMSQIPPKRAQQLMGVQGKQLVAELRGISCHALTTEGKLPQTIAATRTFGHDTTDILAIEAAFATFIASASYKLRRSEQLTRRISIFATTDRHKPGYAVWTKNIRFDQPTADPGRILQATMQAFLSVYNPHVAYHRAGVTLSDFTPAQQLQVDLLGAVDTIEHDRAKRQFAAVDAINNRYGRRTMQLAAEILGSSWQPKYELRSPRYVSRWDELPKLAHYSTGRIRRTASTVLSSNS